MTHLTSEEEKLNHTKAQEAEKMAALKKKETEKKIEALEPTVTNGVAPLSIFEEKPKEVDTFNLFWDNVNKSLSRISNAKTLDDLFLNIVFESLMGPLEFLAASLKERRQNLKEAHHKEKQNRENFINDALKVKGLTRNALASRLSYRMQEWLNDDSLLPRYPDGTLRTKGLNALQRFQYKKLKFAKSLPLVEGENIYDFTRFSGRQKKQYARYMRLYAMENPAFRKYVNEMFETGVTKAELQRIYKVATDMNLRYNTGLKYYHSRERAA